MYDCPLFDGRTLRGLADTIAMMQYEAARLGASSQRTEVVTIKQLREEIEACMQAAAALLLCLKRWANGLRCLPHFFGHTEEIDDIVGALAHEHGQEIFTELRSWISSTSRQAKGCQRDMRFLAPGGLSAQLELSLKISMAKLWRSYRRMRA